jgi:biopolymer transport protein ExbB
MRHLRIALPTALLLAAAVLVAQDAAPAGAAASDATSTYTAIKSGTLWDIFVRGGSIMWPILLTSVVGLAFAIERFIELRRSRHAPKDFHKDVVHTVDTRGVDAGLALCLQKQSSLSRVLYAALLRHGTTRQEMETAVADEGTRVLYDLRKNTRTIGLMSNLAPLLGLLGTCTGLIDCFDKVAMVGGTGRASVLASGVAEALLTTAFGLMVAIPLSFLYFHLKGKADDIVREIDESAIEAVVTLDRKARQSIRLIEDIEEQTKTKDMDAVKSLPPELARELEIDRSTGSGVKSSITTHAGMPAQKPSPEAADEKK